MVSTAARVGSISVLLQTQYGAAVQGIGVFANAIEKGGLRTQRAVGNIDRSVGSMNQSIARINARGFTGLTVGALRASTAMDMLRGLALAAGVAMGGLVPAALLTGMVRVTDGAHRMSNQLRTVTSSSADLKNTQDALFDVAQRTRSSFEATTTIYARTARATEHLNMSQRELLRLTETVQKSFAIGGASTAEAQGAAIQLSQGIASDRFSGDEYRSVAENAPVLLRGMADAIGVNIGKLREMAHAGELTAAVVTKAILEASESIDADFAKTTSTIEQAWVRVGNAVTKYAMDSQGASAASGALVNILNGLALNIDTVADSIFALGLGFAALYGGRKGAAIISGTQQFITGLRAVRAETLANAAANVTLANSEMKTARADFLARRLAFNKALREGTLSAKQLERQKRSLAAASATYQATVTRASLATTQLTSAQNAATASSMALAGAGRAASAAWAFIGGPFGAAILGLGAVFYVLSSESAKAKADMARMAEAGDNVVATLARIEGRAKASGDAIKQFAAGFRDLIRVEGLARAQAEFNALTDAIKDMGGQLNVLRREFSTSAGLSAEQSVELLNLTTRFLIGALSVEEYTARLQEMARVNPDQSKVIADMIDLAQQANHARDAVGEARKEIDALDGKEAKVTITIGTRRIELDDMGPGGKTDRLPGITNQNFDSRHPVPRGTGGKSWEEVFPDLFKKEKKGRGGGGGRSRKTADDRFDNSLQSLADRTEALRLEREALNLSLAEQLRREEALKLEQEALKQVREEARRKGDQDWQNAQLAPGQVAQINEKVAAYVREKMALKEAVETQEAYKEAASETGSVLRHMIDGSMSFKDTLLQLIPVVIKLMNSLNLAAGGKGIFGGGILQSFIGGLFGLSFHSGGTVGAGGKVAQIPAGVPFAGKFHSGGDFGSKRGKHGEILALVEESETILTARNTDRTINALGASIGRMKERAQEVDVRVRGVFVDDGGVVKGIAQGESRTAATAVAATVPRQVDQRMHGRQVRRTRPR